jgi:hypothetical protein
MTWHDKAACRDADPEAFFGSKAEQADTARHYCQRCPVLADCAAEGMTLHYGLWGGMPEGTHGRPRPADSVRDHRRQLVPCPSQTARARHRKRGEPCDVCWPPTVDLEPEARRILREVADGYGLEVADLRASYTTGCWETAAIRDAASRLRDLGMSLPAIGRLLDRDHSTVIYHLKRHEEAA